uniref:Uncharacterized protein n=1 Tax=Arundo donax TaxID=35708 RepID=A0A0A9BPR0_ARUDO
MARSKANHNIAHNINYSLSKQYPFHLITQTIEQGGTQCQSTWQAGAADQKVPFGHIHYLHNQNS